MTRAIFLFSSLTLLVGGCSSGSKKELVTFPAGEKATVGPLVYSVIDTEVVPQLGDDPNNIRTPQNRFYLVQMSVSNSSNSDVPIPDLTLVDDSGQQYAELADGTNVPDWLGVVRKVGAAQTEQGTIVFDAPAKHYRLRLTDETEAREISVDVPLNFFVHQQQPDIGTMPAAVPENIGVPRK
jgi:hypothetical protein